MKVIALEEAHTYLLGCQWRGCQSRLAGSMTLLKTQPGACLVIVLCTEHHNALRDFFTANLGSALLAKDYHAACFLSDYNKSRTADPKDGTQP
jgi:hypothetical protein